MLEKQSNGDVRFKRPGKKAFIFEKDNYQNHCAKHSELKYNPFLMEIEETLYNPDVVTEAPRMKRTIFYRVVNEAGKHQVSAVKVVCKGGKIVFWIVSSFHLWSIASSVVNYMEKIIWRKKTSII